MSQEPYAAEPLPMWNEAAAAELVRRIKQLPPGAKFIIGPSQYVWNFDRQGIREDVGRITKSPPNPVRG